MHAKTEHRMFFRVSPAAVLTLVVGVSITGLLFGQQLPQSWPGALIGAVFTLLLAFYLQLVAIHNRHAAELLTAVSAELAISKQMLEYDAAARDFSAQALQLRDRAIELSANAISIYDATDPDFPLAYVNPAFEKMTGYTKDDILGTPCCVLHSGVRNANSVPMLRGLLNNRQSGNVVLRNEKKDGSFFWSEMHIAPVADANGVIKHFVAAQTDITALRSYEEQLRHKAHYDALTGLANRALLRDRLTIALQFAAPTSRQVWVLFLGLDRFKTVNEINGHDVGDAVLKVIATRLTECVKVSDTVSRFGGDEFIIVLQDLPDEKAAMSRVEKILANMKLPFATAENNFFIGCSVGIAVYPADGEDAESLIMHADNAMHGAKSKGSGSFHFYAPYMNQRAMERAKMEADLRLAIERNEFILHYQPQVDLRSGRMIGMEALIRWQHPERGQVPPLEFIGLAEETGLIIDIGSWVIRTACAQMKLWQNLGFEQLRISVNLSPRQFSDARLVSEIGAVLAATTLDPRYFQLELTESLVMADIETGIRILQEMKALGISIAIDDFGTGYSSLSYLRRLPIDTLKIDRSFVSDITLATDDAVIVRSIISLAHSLRMRVVAEGVETRDQLSFLQLHDCDEIQGYHFSRPVSAADFTALLQQNKSLPAFSALKQAVPLMAEAEIK
ncbi:MAG: EAL domain-containing protein [Pseudomonadota bacterium]